MDTISIYSIPRHWPCIVVRYPDGRTVETSIPDIIVLAERCKIRVLQYSITLNAIGQKVPLWILPDTYPPLSASKLFAMTIFICDDFLEIT